MLKIFALVILVCFPQLNGECRLLMTDYLPIYMTDSECKELLNLETESLKKEYEVDVQYSYCLPLEKDMYVNE